MKRRIKVLNILLPIIVVITPTYAQLFLYYIHLAYMFRPSWASSGQDYETLVILNALMMTN
jgi:hypothetical protein